MASNNLFIIILRVSCVVLVLIWCGLARAAAFTWGGQLGAELTRASWALHRPDLPMWSFIFLETRPGFYTWWQELSKKASSNGQAVINSLPASHLLMSHWPKSHTQKPELVWKGVDTGRSDSLQAMNVTIYNSSSLIGLLLLPILLIPEACYSLTKFPSYLLHILAF